jgi:hypothetical protein
LVNILSDFITDITDIHRGISISFIFFVLWFSWSGWLNKGGYISREPQSPITQNSQWQNMSDAIESGTSPLCVPIDPLGWFYMRNCKILGIQPNLAAGYTFLVSKDDSSLQYQLPLPEAMSEPAAKLTAIAMIVRTTTVQGNWVTAQVEIKLKNGDRKYMYGDRYLTHMGALLMLTMKNGVATSDIDSASVSFNTPVEIATINNTNNTKNVVYWLGADANTASTLAP